MPIVKVEYNQFSKIIRRVFIWILMASWDFGFSSIALLKSYRIPDYCLGMVRRRAFCIPRGIPLLCIFWQTVRPFFFFFFGHVARHVGSYFPDQGLNPRPWQWKIRVLPTGPPGNSHARPFLSIQILIQKHPFLLSWKTLIHSGLCSSRRITCEWGRSHWPMWPISDSHLTIGFLYFI